MNTTTNTNETFIIFARDYNNSFPTETRRTLADAIVAGLATRKSFDVHLPSGAIAWTWEQRPGQPAQDGPSVGELIHATRLAGEICVG
jgi:hypothetical protein